MSNTNSPAEETVPYKPNLTVLVNNEEDATAKGASLTPVATPTPHVSTNIFVAGLPYYWDEDQLRKHYQQFGEIISTKVVRNKHFGFVMFRHPADAHEAINKTHLTRPDSNLPTVLHVSIAMHDEGVNEEPNKRLFVRGLPQWATKEHLQILFSKYGTIVECAVLMNPLGQCKGSGFVQFEELKEAAAAIEDSEKIRMEDWPHALVLKYSESPEVRRQRQERNKGRHQRSPKFKGASTAKMPPVSPSMSSYSHPVSLLPSPQNYTMFNSVGFPIVYPSSLPASPMPTQMYPNSFIHPNSLAPYLIPYPPSVSPGVPNARTSPQKGDIYLVGGPLNEDIVRMLVQPFGMIECVVPPSNERVGFIVRMVDRSLHTTIAQQLNGTYFSTGQLLTATIYA